MKLHSQDQDRTIRSSINIPGSKSESNRLLILQALFPDLQIKNLSDSDDSRLLRNALDSTRTTVDIGHAGTAMRFLTAFYAFQNGEKTLTGSKRMQNRPIALLVDALTDLGADIRYQNKTGYPPLIIKGTTPRKNTVEIKAEVSSQYISALLLIAPGLPNGLRIHLKGRILSRPYINMTLNLLRQLGVKTNWEEKIIHVSPLHNASEKTITVESDWSGASYFYSFAALARSSKLTLSSFWDNSLQGDAKVARFYEQFGVYTQFKEGRIQLTKSGSSQIPENFEADLTDYPDLAQTLAVTCLGLKIPCYLRGLHNLKIKETDRLAALQNELSKFGAQVEIDDNSLKLLPPEELNGEITVETYQDHRMAMAFAPLMAKTSLFIKDPGVVTKSFPGFWANLPMG